LFGFGRTGAVARNIHDSQIYSTPTCWSRITSRTDSPLFGIKSKRYQVEIPYWYLSQNFERYLRWLQHQVEKSVDKSTGHSTSFDGEKKKRDERIKIWLGIYLRKRYQAILAW
jgi:hypothetical protein